MMSHNMIHIQTQCHVSIIHIPPACERLEVARFTVIIKCDKVRGDAKRTIRESSHFTRIGGGGGGGISQPDRQINATSQHL